MFFHHAWLLLSVDLIKAPQDQEILNKKANFTHGVNLYNIELRWLYDDGRFITLNLADLWALDQNLMIRQTWNSRFTFEARYGLA